MLLGKSQRALLSGIFHFCRAQYTKVTMEPAPSAPYQPAKGSYGSVLSILLIVLILVMGAFYMWNKRVAENATRYATPDESTAALEEAEATP